GGQERAGVLGDRDPAGPGADGAPEPEVEVPGFSVGDRRRPPAARVASSLGWAVHRLEDGHPARALRDLEPALRLAAPEQSRRIFREAPDELWQLLRSDDELWSRHEWLTARRTVAGTIRLPQSRGGTRPVEL